MEDQSVAHDPTVDEVRAIRDAFAKENNYDVARIVEALRKQPLPPGSQVISLPAKRLPKARPGQKSG